MIDDEERERRRSSIESALGTMRLCRKYADFELEPWHAELARRYIDGEITALQMGDQVRRRYRIGGPE